MKYSIRKIVIFAVLVLALSASHSIAGDDPYPEHEVKAAFLYNFMRFTDWPAEKIDDVNKPMVVYVVGDYPPCKTFTDVRNKRLNNKPVEVRIYNSFEQIEDPNILRSSHVLLICDSEKKHAVEILNIVKNSNVITVGESEKFLDKGGVINFISSRQKVRFEINITAAEKSQLKIRSKLLKLAHRVVKEKSEN